MTKLVPHELNVVFQQLKRSSQDGVSGVFRVQSGIPGPVVGITICTHGNEPTGLAVFDSLVNKENLHLSLKKGVIYFILNNICATNHYFDAKDEKAVRLSRYCDVNMNRLPDSILGKSGFSEYEVCRAQELLPFFERFDYAIDIHSTLDVSDPMIISRGGTFFADIIKGFPITTLIANIDMVQIGKPVFSLYGKPGEDIPVFAIEAGKHVDPKSFQCAIDCVGTMLSNLGMVQEYELSHNTTYNEYFVEDSILFKDISYDWVKDFKHLDRISKGELLARSTQNFPDMYAEKDGHMIMPTSRRGEEKDISEEVAFLSRPVQRRIL